VMHAGPYTTGDHAAKEAFIKQMAPLFAKQKVDLVLQAHDHTYSRTLPYRWAGAGYTTSEADSQNLNLAPKTADAEGPGGGVPFYLNPEGTVYVSAGCAGHRVGEQDEYATRGHGTLSYDTHTYKTATDSVKVDSSYGKAGDDGSRDLGKPMFGVLRVSGNRLVFDWFVVEADGSGELFDSLRICKEFPPTAVDPDGNGSAPTLRPVEGTNGVYVLEVKTNSTKTVSIAGLKATDVLLVPEQIDCVQGAAPGQIVVVAEATNGAQSVAVEVTKAFKIADDGHGGATIELDESPSAEVEVTVGGQTERIKVTPELAAFALGERTSACVKTIPGLVYALKRSEELPGVAFGETVARERAKGTRLELADPMTHGKPQQAFYLIECSK